MDMFIALHYHLHPHPHMSLYLVQNSTERGDGGLIMDSSSDVFFYFFFSISLQTLWPEGIGRQQPGQE